MQAALNGSREIGFTIVSMTVSLVAVFIPVLFLGGILGRLFREFAVTISVAILISGFVSLSLTPMLCSRLLKAVGRKRPGEDGPTSNVQGPKSEMPESTAEPKSEPHEPAHSSWWQASERVYEWMVGGYKWMLQLVLEHRLLTVLISVVLFAVTIVLFYVIPKGFIPNDDTSQIVGYTEAAQGISFAEMSRHQEELVDLIRTNKMSPASCRRLGKAMSARPATAATS